MMGRVLIAIPLQDSDPSEVAIAWQLVIRDGHQVVFATEDGSQGKSDEIVLTGQGLDLWGAVPFLKRLPAIGLLMRANKDARQAYKALILSDEFRSPIRWDEIDVASFDGLFVPGGHRARGMRPFLESEILHSKVVEFFEADKPVGAVCHGVLLLARSKSPKTGKSALFGRKTTGLTWALENTAWSITRWTRFWDCNYYRTYMEEPGQPAGYMSVQQEVSRALERPEDFLDVPKSDPNFGKKTSGTSRDTLTDDSPAFVVRDGNYVSGRWPGDVHTLAKTFSSLLTKSS